MNVQEAAYLRGGAHARRDQEGWTWTVRTSERAHLDLAVALLQAAGIAVAYEEGVDP